MAAPYDAAPRPVSRRRRRLLAVRAASLPLVSEGALVLLSIVAAFGLAALGCYALSSVLVMGGRSALWLESHRWVYALLLVGGGSLLTVACALSLWPLAALGGAIVLVALGRYLLLNV